MWGFGGVGSEGDARGLGLRRCRVSGIIWAWEHEGQEV